MKTTPDQIEKLPKWAQEHIKDLARQREVAVNALREVEDRQTESAFYTDLNECTGEASGPSRVRSYFQASHVVCTHRGVTVTIYALPNRNISVQWEQAPRYTGGEVACVPESFQRIELVAKENMRA